MKQSLTLEVTRLVHTEEGRTIGCRVVNARPGELQNIDLKVPDDQPSMFGDTLEITIDWPDY